MEEPSPNDSERRDRIGFTMGDDEEEAPPISQVRVNLQRVLERGNRRLSLQIAFAICALFVALGLLALGERLLPSVFSGKDAWPIHRLILISLVGGVSICGGALYGFRRYL